MLSPQVAGHRGCCARPLITLELGWMAAGASRRQPLLLGRTSPLRKTSSCCPSATASDGISEYGSALRLGAMLDPVSRASGVVVNLMLLTSVHTTTRVEYNRAWSRSSDALRAVRKRRAPTFDVAQALGQISIDLPVRHGSYNRTIVARARKHNENCVFKALQLSSRRCARQKNRNLQ